MERELQKIEREKRIAVAILPAMVVLLALAYAYINSLPLIPFLVGIFVGLLFDLFLVILFD